MTTYRKNGGQWLAALMHLSHEYTTETFYGFRWGNMLEAILLPQRSFQLGLPLSIIIMTLWWQAIEAPRETHERDRTERWSFARFRLAISSYPMRRMLGAGAITGLLPLAHTTTFGVMMGMAACLALLLRRWQRWGCVFCGSVAGRSAASLVVWSWKLCPTEEHVCVADWMGQRPANFWWFWFENTGLFIPAPAIALVWGASTRTMSRRFLLFYAPFLLCFIGPNLLRLMPWIWDNIKALIYWYIASVPLVAILLARIWRVAFLVPSLLRSFLFV